MKLITYQLSKEQGARLGIVHNDLVIDMKKLGTILGISLPKKMLKFIDLGPNAVTSIAKELKSIDNKQLINCSVPFSNVQILAPIPKPRKNIFGIGLNYTEHVAESARELDTSGKLPTKCIIFSKPTTTIIGPNDPVEHNEKVTKQLDYEGELCVIIGSKAKNVAKKDALKYVFGYTIINDISARDCRREGQWIVSKGQDTFAPMGPMVITADELKDPHCLNLSTKVNGVEKQNANTKFMLFNVSDIIADISESMTLEPGDIIASGTPAGVGAGRSPQEFMWPGDVVEVSIEGIGTLSNPIVKKIQL